MIQVQRPSIGDEELAEVKKVFDTGWLGMGKWVFDFENRIKEILGAGNVVAVNTGTTALHLALDSIGLKEGDEVIVPSLTFVATIQAIVACGAAPVFCDIDGDTLNMDAGDVEKRITARTKVIMPVHYGGLPCNMNEILRIGKEKNLTIVEDAAHAFGSSYNGRKIGAFGDITCFSFDPIKNITCGEGGAITTNDYELAQVMRKKRILGIDKDTWSRFGQKRDWFYSVNMLGFRYHMSNINAAIGLMQLEKLGRFLNRKRGIVERYDKAFRGLSGIGILRKDYENTAFFSYILKIESKRDEFIDFLKSKGIDSGVHYIPNHLQPFFEKYATELPVTETVWKEIVTLPLYPDMSDDDVDLVISSVLEFCKQ
ncbi:MAG: DegT/DnrJ/EryC1/StrS aminotransferase family protein [Proteobacteria bacterium]|nr:DegT/DnrJ/EryC1/StrS aminotransferase family protein [Pseudomonadota bacterium]